MEGLDLSNIDLSRFSMPELSFNSLVDILIIAFISYKILLWTKETRAWSLFKGIAIVLCISTLANQFQLHTISWVIENTINVGIIAIIIIFQPELRKALEQIGKGRFIKFFTTSNTKNSHEFDSFVVEEIVTACAKMAKVKTGALIVVERSVALGDLESTGVPIDALVSFQLLVNIFEDKTPLHDGAVVIRNGRISAATCILPLTQTKVSSELGTRHRAAIGASEVSDAFVIVVSEETGHISIAQGGKLHRNLSENDARLMLSSDNIPKKKSPIWRGLVK